MKIQRRAKTSSFGSLASTISLCQCLGIKLTISFLFFFSTFCRLQFLIQLQLKVEHLQVYRKQHKITFHRYGPTVTINTLA